VFDHSSYSKNLSNYLFFFISFDLLLNIFLYTHSFIYFINIFNKTNGRAATASNILKRREYSPRTSHKGTTITIGDAIIKMQ
jgi:hypothetical protein